MSEELKKYQTKEITLSSYAQREEEILAQWKEKDIFKKTLAKESPKGEFTFFEGPPTANGRPGIHHVLARSFKDIIPRYKTMQGFSVRRKAGWDTHGLPVELQVEKQLGLKSKKEIENYGIAEFNQKCKESVWQYKDEWEKLTTRMGYWLDMEHPYVTYDNGYIEALWGTVAKIHDNGNLYKDFKVVPWCSRCGTTLSSHELNQPGAYKDVKDISITAKFELVDEPGMYLLAWTTTPWTLPGNVALAVGEDIDYVLVEYTYGIEVGSGKQEIKTVELQALKGLYILAKERVSVLPPGYLIRKEMKGSDLVGKKYKPLFPYFKDLAEKNNIANLENAYKIYSADFVTTTDGTGIVHTAVMYGQDDFELGTNIGLPKMHIVTEQGTYVDDMGFLSGRYVKEETDGKPTLDVDIIKHLQDTNTFFAKEKYEHSYPHCWRCDTPLVYYARSSWYFKSTAVREAMMSANKNIHWEPEHVRDGRFGEWLDGIKDWAISRDRYWGTPLPVWQTESGKRVVIGGVDDIKKYSKKSGNKYFVMRHGHAQSNINHIWESGNDANNHLTEQGVQVIKESVKNFSEKIDVIIHSPVLRTLETARVFAEETGYIGEMIVDERIREMNPGDKYQGKPLSDYLSQFEHFVDRYRVENPDGENYLDVRKRVMEALYDYEKNYQNKNILIVSHGGPILNMILSAAGTGIHMITNDVESIAYPKNAEIRLLDFTPLPHNENYELDLHKPYIDMIELELDGEKMTRTPEVMDVWFDSGCMPIAQDHALGASINFNPKPADYISEGLDQTRGWFYTMHAVANLVHNTPTMAYKNVICLGLVLDAQGQKMSKSRGNVVNPWDMFATYGADTIRFWFYSVNQPGEFKNFDEKTIIETQRKLFGLLDNTVKFYEMYGGGSSVSVNPYDSKNVLDLWILAKLSRLIESCTADLDRYRVLEPARAIRDFVTDFSQWYIRRSRERFKDEGEDKQYAVATTQHVIQEVSKILAPFTPLFAEDMYQRSGGSLESVHLENWPIPMMNNHDMSNLVIMEDVRMVISTGLQLRAQANIKVRQPLSSFTITAFTTQEVSPQYFDIIKDEMNVKEIIVGDMITLDTNVTPELKSEGIFREIVRSLQDMRKEKGLKPGEFITLDVVTSDEGREIMTRYQQDFQKLAHIRNMVLHEGVKETPASLTVEGISLWIEFV